MTTATQKFIEKAIEGGWNKGNVKNCSIWFLGASHGKEHDESGCFVVDHTWADPHSETAERKGNVFHYDIATVLLDPLAWQAVGRVEGWEGSVLYRWYPKGTQYGTKHPMWQHNMHRMVDALAERKTVDEFLATLTQDQ